MPTVSPDPDEVHRRFWERKLTRPINAPFWNRHQPGDRWNCKCSLEATDAPVTDIPGETDQDQPQPGLKGNPAKTKQIFDKSHPYFPKSCKGCKFNKGLKNKLTGWFTNADGDCYTCKGLSDLSKQDILEREKIKERRKYILQNYAGIVPKEVTHPEFDRIVHISKTTAKEWTNQPQGAIFEKNELLLEFDKVFPKTKYLKHDVGVDYADNTVKIHLFFTQINKIDSWIIVKEFPNGECRLHSVSDSPSIVEKIKKKQT